MNNGQIGFIKTAKGDFPVVGRPIGDFLMITPTKDVWTVFHLKSGYVIAYFKDKKTAQSIAEVLDVTCNWDWESPEQMPNATAEMVHKIFSALCHIVEFVASPFQ